LDAMLSDDALGLLLQLVEVTLSKLTSCFTCCNGPNGGVQLRRQMIQTFPRKRKGLGFERGPVSMDKARDLNRRTLVADVDRELDINFRHTEVHPDISNPAELLCGNYVKQSLRPVGEV
jgi:hypothetical protein